MEAAAPRRRPAVGGDLLQSRFEAYKKNVVRPVFRDHFARLDRQIVLVDALSAIDRGPAALADLERTLAAVLACFRTGGNGFLSSFVTGVKAA